MTLTATHSLPLILDEVEVTRVSRLSPTFTRVEFAGASLADFGVDGPLFDQRIKLIFPAAPGGALPSFEGADESWFGSWLERPVAERGHMRTYTVRDVLGSGADTRLIVDFALHELDESAGPGARWAAAARAGDRLVLMGPRRGLPYGGIEFTPGAAERLLLAGDETAVPAACAILGQLPADARGAAFLEVPHTADVQAVRHPAGVEVVWLPRDGAPLGSLLGAAVLDHLGAPPVEPVADDEVDPDLWETPTYSSSGEEVAATEQAAHFLADCYAWIAGESKVVTTLRRALVSELGMDRRQVAFMGYWRQGVAMRS